MYKKLLTSEVQKFIRDHEFEDGHKLLLKHKQVNDVPISIVVEQIVGRRKAKDKLPSYYHRDGIIFPPGINLEQCSSEQTAQYKIDIIKSLKLQKHERAIDLTGGFGVDTLYLGIIFTLVDYVEKNESLSQIAKHNHSILNQLNINYHANSVEAFLRRLDDDVDLIYIDPSRRNSSGKVFRFSECGPDITKYLEEVFQKTNHLLVKASPLLDIQQALSELKFVFKIFVVSINNECKELLFLCLKDYQGDIAIEAVDIRKDSTVSFFFQQSEEKMLTINFGDPLKYLFEPNASILKAGAFKSVAHRFGLNKIHPNTHLYTADNIISSFPGRIFEIESFVKPQAKTLKEYFPKMQANILLRNYPLRVADLIRKVKITEGGEKYLIGFSGRSMKYLAAANRIA